MTFGGVKAAASRTAGLASAVLALIILLHGALIPGGRWDADEYFNFGLLRVDGWVFAWHRLYQWSPRPVSEAVLWAYDAAVTFAGSQLIVPFLIAMWAALIGGGLLALWRPRMPGAAWRLCIVLGTLAMMLLGHPVSEMFYWPMAAAPYLLAMAGVVVLAFRFISGRVETMRDRTICMLALMLAGGSAEVGLFFVLGCAGLLAVVEFPGQLRRRAFGDAIWYGVPLLLCVATLLVWLVFRVANASGGIVADQTYFHHMPASLRGALLTAPSDFFGRRTAGLLIAALLFLAGLVGCMRAGLPGAVPARHLLALVVGVAVSCFGSIAGALFQFGVLCCERQHTFRQGLIVVLLVAVAKLLAGKFERSGPREWIGGPLLVVLATVPGLITRVPGIVNDARLLPINIGVREQNWAMMSSRDAQSVFHLPVPGEVINGLSWPPGHYVRDQAPWFVVGVLTYFGRQQGELVETNPDGTRSEGLRP